MKQKETRAKTIDQSNDSTSINNKRGMARRAKRNTSKRLRQALKKDEKNILPYPR